MKKLIITVILFLNLIPHFHNNKIVLSGSGNLFAQSFGIERDTISDGDGGTYCLQTSSVTGPAFGEPCTLETTTVEQEYDCDTGWTIPTSEGGLYQNSQSYSPDPNCSPPCIGCGTADGSPPGPGYVGSDAIPPPPGGAVIQQSTQVGSCTMFSTVYNTTDADNMLQSLSTDAWTDLALSTGVGLVSTGGGIALSALQILRNQQIADIKTKFDGLSPSPTGLVITVSHCVFYETGQVINTKVVSFTTSGGTDLGVVGF